MENVKIVVDSSADMLSLEGIDFAVTPLKIITSDKEFTDDEKLDVKEMVDYLSTYKGRSSTSCPNAMEWLEAFGESKYVFCVAITATLSGSYNAAVNAKAIYEEKYPDRKVFVINSLSAGPELSLIAQKIKELCLEDLSFEDVCKKITVYMQKTGLLFMLQSMNNLANNGRVSPIIAKMAGFLGIRVVGKASDKGDLEQLAKCRGEVKALETLASLLKEAGLNSGRVLINHIQNISAAQSLKEIIFKKIPDAKITVKESRGLCSFYAENGGLLIGFEKI